MSNWIIHSEKRQWKNHEYEKRVVEGEGVPGYIYPEGNSNHNTTAKEGRKEASPGVDPSEVRAMKALLEDGFSVTDYHANEDGDPVFGIKTPSGDVHEFVGVPSKGEMKKWMNEQRSKKSDSKTDTSKEDSTSKSSKKGKSSSSNDSSSSSKKSGKSSSGKSGGSSKKSSSKKSDSDDSKKTETSKSKGENEEAKMRAVLPAGFEIYKSYEEDGNTIFVIETPSGDLHEFEGIPSEEEMNKWANSLKHSMCGDYVAVSKEAYLSHHGILGMKWGVRRYQNADGSLTDAGRKRYGSGNPIVAGGPKRNSLSEKASQHGINPKRKLADHLEREKTYVNSSGEKKGMSTGKKVAIAAGVAAAVGLTAYGAYKYNKLMKSGDGKRMIANGKKIIDNLKRERQDMKAIRKENNQIRKERKRMLRMRRSLSDHDLIENIGRLEREAKYKDLLKKDLRPGDSEINEILSSSGKKVATMVLSGAGLYAGNAMLKESFNRATAADWIFQKPNWKK